MLPVDGFYVSKSGFRYKLITQAYLHFDFRLHAQCFHLVIGGLSLGGGVALMTSTMLCLPATHVASQSTSSQLASALTCGVVRHVVKERK
jgi:esterase/lipase